jgi:hypothetical protein
VSLGAAAGAGLGGLGGATGAQFGTALSGVVMLLLGAMSPWAVLSLLPAVEAGMAAARQRQAATAGPRSAVQGVYVGSYLSRLTQSAGRSAGVVAGGWATSPAVMAQQLRALAQTSAAQVARMTPGQRGGAPGGPTGQRGSSARQRGPNRRRGGQS